MCETRIELPDGMMVCCRKCGQCRKDRLKFWIGRCCAESVTASDVWMLTFTYDGGYDNEGAYYLDYRDPQLMFKRLRKAGHKFKYLITGEYGAKGKRAHWHALIFWEGAAPCAEFDKQKYHWRFWKMGFTYIERPRAAASGAAYICKYMLKDHEAVVRWSDDVGGEYLIDLAKRHARQGLELWPDGKTYYTVPDCGFDRKLSNGKVVRESYKYVVRAGSSIFRRMVNAYCEEWQSCRKGQRVRLSPPVHDEIERLQEHWRVSDLMRDFIEFQTGYMDPPAVGKQIYDMWRGDVLKITTTDIPGVIVARQGEAKELRFINYEGKELWRDQVSEEEIQKALRGLKPELPERVEVALKLLQERLRQEGLLKKTTTNEKNNGLQHMQGQRSEALPLVP